MIDPKSIWGHFLAGKPFVHRNGDELTLQFSPASIQSQLRPDEPDRLLLGYTRTLLGFLLFVPHPQRISMIGLGGGSLPTYCFNHLPDSLITVAEINPDVIALRDTFRIPSDNERFSVHCTDGAALIASMTGSENVIIVDGFDVGGQAPTLCTDIFYRDCYQALASGGVMAVNLSENAKEHARYIKRMQACFGEHVIVVKAEDCTNKVVFAIKPARNDDTLSLKDLLARATLLDKQYPVSFRHIVERMAMNRHNSLPDRAKKSGH